MTTNENLGDLKVGDSASIHGEVIHVSDPSVDLTEPAAGRIGRTVSLFVETDEDPTAAAVDSAGNAQDPRTFAELTEGADDYRESLNRPDAAATPQAQRPDVTLES